MTEIKPRKTILLKRSGITQAVFAVLLIQFLISCTPTVADITETPIETATELPQNPSSTPTLETDTPIPSATRDLTETWVPIGSTATIRPTVTPYHTITPKSIATKALPIRTPLPTTEFHPPQTRTGIEEVDQIIDTVLKNDGQALRNLMLFRPVGCTHQLGMGGPPKCEEGEDEGTRVNVFQILGSEGMYIRENAIGESYSLGEALGVYAVYYASDGAFLPSAVSEDHSADEISIYFVHRYEDVILRVKNGRIITFDYIFENTPTNRVTKEAGEFLLPPPRYNLDSPDPQPTDLIVHEQNIRTGITEIDQVIDAVLQGDVEKQKELISFTSIQCTHQEGLGGPPKCDDGQEEGESLEVLPILGSEGHFILKEKIDEWKGIQALGLYAVYEVSGEAYSAASYPAGDIGILFLLDPHVSIIFHITNGKITRVNYILGNTPERKLKQEAGAFILEPPSSSG